MRLSEDATTRLMNLLQPRTGPLEGALQRRFPSICRGRVEDAVASALADLCGRPELVASLLSISEAEATGRLFVMAWRHLRGQWRRKSYQLEDALDELELPPTWEEARSPEAAMMAWELQERVRALVAEAAAQCGGASSDRVAEALCARLFDGLSDVEAARRYGVRREYVNRGKRMVLEALA